MAQISIKYFGITQEITSHSEQIINFEGTLYQLIQYLYDKYPQLNNSKIQVAYNMELISKDQLKQETYTQLMDKDEIVFLPPFAGG